MDRLQRSSTDTPVNGSGAIDCQELFGRYTLDAATEFLFGGSVVSASPVAYYLHDLLLTVVMRPELARGRRPPRRWRRAKVRVDRVSGYRRCSLI